MAGKERTAMTKVQFYEEVEDHLLKYAVIIARAGDQWVFCKHRDRETYEVPGGHREPGEKIDDTARRELYEETGAVRYTLQPVCVYSVTVMDGSEGQEEADVISVRSESCTGRPGICGTEESFGMLYYARIDTFEPELHSEIEKILLTKELPGEWTYPEIQPRLLEEAYRRGILRKLYLDRTGGEAVSVYVRDAEVIPAGTTVYSMPLRERNPVYDRWGREYGIYFLFEDMQVEIPFYAVPWVDLFAVDGQGGFFGTVGRGTDLEGEGPVCYFKEGKCRIIAESGPEFIANAAEWRQRLRDYPQVTLYDSREQAARELEFISLNDGK